MLEVVLSLMGKKTGRLQGAPIIIELLAMMA